MMTKGPVVWIVCVVVFTAVTFGVSTMLKTLNWEPYVREPIAQAAGLYAALLIALPYMRRQAEPRWRGTAAYTLGTPTAIVAIAAARIYFKVG